MGKIIIGVILIFVLLPIVSADIAIPGQHSIDINNKITNLNEFPDYVIVSAPDDNVGYGPGFGMCPIELIGEDGLILGGYKFCEISVYAIEKENINIDDLKDGNINIDDLDFNETQMMEYFLSFNPIKVLEQIEHYAEVSDSDPRQEINNFYEVSFDELKTEPNDIIIKRDYSLYFYIGIPLIALIAIIVILIKRRK